jgi:hypothetical protein
MFFLGDEKKVKVQEGTFFFFFLFFSVLGTELRALPLPGKRSSTELNPQPLQEGT